MSAIDTREIRVRPAREDEVEAVAAVLMEAFRSEGFTNWIFDLSTPQHYARMMRSHALVARLRLAEGHRVLVAAAGEEIVGLAMVKAPQAPRKLSLLERLRLIAPHLLPLAPLVGQVRWRRLPATGNAMRAPAEAVEGRHTLEILAVAPAHQGRGIGRMLLAAVHALAQADAESQGVYLYTADERNRRIYTRAGYRVASQEAVDDRFVVYHMVRDRTPELCCEVRRLVPPEPARRAHSHARSNVAASDLVDMLALR